MISLLRCFAAATGALTPPEGSPARTASVLFIAVFLLLGAFFLGVVLISIMRRRRSDSRAKARQESDVDPWREAGRRAQPLDPPSSDID